MKILVIDRDETSFQMIRARPGLKSAAVEYEPEKARAMDRLLQGDFSMVFLNPAPLASGRALILNMRRALAGYPYIFIVTDNRGSEGRLEEGCNACIERPFDLALLDQKIDAAQRLSGFIKNLCNHKASDGDNTPGIIAQPAFEQIFLAAMDRADRCGEPSYIAEFILKRPADDPAAVVRLAEAVAALRRRSDIIGRCGPRSFALLLQRPVEAKEPAEAAARFAENLEAPGAAHAGVELTLFEMPSGRRLNHYEISF